MAATVFAFAPSPTRGTMRPVAGMSFDEPDPGAPPLSADREAEAVYDDLTRPGAFPIPKGEDDGSAD